MAKKRGKKAKEAEEVRVKCARCDLTYTMGAPHFAFCRGKVPKDGKCIHCSNDEHDSLKECRSCGQIICDCCEESGEHQH